jgi:hypothetical protein
MYCFILAFMSPDIYPVQIVAILPKSTSFIQISNENTYFRSHDYLFLPISITDAFSILPLPIVTQQTNF